MSGHESANPMVTDVFVKGAVQGWNIAVTSTIPNVLMAFVIIKVLNHSGLLTIFSRAKLSRSPLQQGRFRATRRRSGLFSLYVLNSLCLRAPVLS